MKLFDEVERCETRSMNPTEAHFTYYNTSARPFITAMREVQERWFDDYPSGRANEDLRARFRSDNDSQHRGAQFELFLHALLRAMGFILEPHPEVPGGKGTHPDFLVLRSSERLFYAEATIAEPSQRRNLQNQGMAKIQDAINAVDSPNFYISMNIESTGPGAPPVREVRDAVRRLVRDLDPEKVGRETENGASAPSLPLNANGWVIELSAWPRSAARRGIAGQRSFSSMATPLTRMDVDERVRAAVRGKAKRYGTLDLPLVVAVNVVADPLDNIEIMEALFGKEVWTVDFGAEKPIATMTGRRPDGAWFRPNGFSNSRVSAVFLCDRMSPGDVFHRRTCLVHHPAAKLPLGKELWPLPQLVPDPTMREMRPIPGKSAGEVLGLPTPWPPTAD